MHRKYPGATSFAVFITVGVVLRLLLELVAPNLPWWVAAFGAGMLGGAAGLITERRLRARSTAGRVDD